MRLVGLEKLREFKETHSLARKAIDAWIMEVEKGDWPAPKYIKERYKTADFLSDNRVIFNIKGNHFRLLVRIKYSHRIVLVEWIGTHAERAARYAVSAIHGRVAELSDYCGKELATLHRSGESPPLRRSSSI